jgi:NADH dehydrogenase
MATIARFRAVAYRGRLHMAGLLAWIAWLVVHLAFLTGFKNRIAAIANWAAAFLGRGRRQRTITASAGAGDDADLAAHPAPTT